MSTHLRSNIARRRAQLVSDGVTASYIHDITRPVIRARAVGPVAAPPRLLSTPRSRSGSRRMLAAARAAA